VSGVLSFEALSRSPHIERADPSTPYRVARQPISMYRVR
jgi:hypothetical protein